eukprot:tig00021072_g17972.t1
MLHQRSAGLGAGSRRLGPKSTHVVATTWLRFPPPPPPPPSSTRWGPCSLCKVRAQASCRAGGIRFRSAEEVLSMARGSQQQRERHELQAAGECLREASKLMAGLAEAPASSSGRPSPAVARFAASLAEHDGGVRCHFCLDPLPEPPVYLSPCALDEIAPYMDPEGERQHGVDVTQFILMDDSAPTPAAASAPGDTGLRRTSSRRTGNKAGSSCGGGEVAKVISNLGVGCMACLLKALAESKSADGTLKCRAGFREAGCGEKHAVTAGGGAVGSELAYQPCGALDAVLGIARGIRSARGLTPGDAAASKPWKAAEERSNSKLRGLVEVIVIDDSDDEEAPPAPPPGSAEVGGGGPSGSSGGGRGAKPPPRAPGKPRHPAPPPPEVEPEEDAKEAPVATRTRAQGAGKAPDAAPAPTSELPAAASDPASGAGGGRVSGRSRGRATRPKRPKRAAASGEEANGEESPGSASSEAEEGGHPLDSATVRLLAVAFSTPRGREGDPRRPGEAAFDPGLPAGEEERPEEEEEEQQQQQQQQTDEEAAPEEALHEIDGGRMVATPHDNYQRCIDALEGRRRRRGRPGPAAAAGEGPCVVDAVGRLLCSNPALREELRARVQGGERARSKGMMLVGASIFSRWRRFVADQEAKREAAAGGAGPSKSTGKRVREARPRAASANALSKKPQMELYDSAAWGKVLKEEVCPLFDPVLGDVGALTKPNGTPVGESTKSRRYTFLLRLGQALARFPPLAAIPGAAPSARLLRAIASLAHLGDEELAALRRDLKREAGRGGRDFDPSRFVPVPTGSGPRALALAPVAEGGAKLECVLDTPLLELPF